LLLITVISAAAARHDTASSAKRLSLPPLPPHVDAAFWPCRQPP